MSAGRLKVGANVGEDWEAEALHSSSKLSASKTLSARRRAASARTPGVRKRLRLGEYLPPGRELVHVCEGTDVKMCYRSDLRCGVRSSSLGQWIGSTHLDVVTPS